MTPMFFCFLTGTQLSENDVKIHPQTSSLFVYETPQIGKAKLAYSTYLEFKNNRAFKHPELAGICRNAYENNEEPPVIDSDFMTKGINQFSIPKSFKEKVRHLLHYLYKKGGNDYAEFTLGSLRDFPLVFASGEEEFNKIMKHLEDRYFIKVDNPLRMAGHRVDYLGVSLTDLGIEEAEKELPKMPMIGLVNQDIISGDAEIDKTINHAKKLFFEAPQTLDKMRSACESLSYVLEPLKKDCEGLFGKKDTNDFFQIVNEFDIRHNKHTTKQIQYTEQLEWIFYSLLNTINTYTKLKLK